MNREDKNIGGVIVFICIIIILLCGGLYLITHKDIYLKQDEKKQEDVNISIKIDEAKDYIYYTDVEELDPEAGLEYKTINLNINSTAAKEVETKLNEEMNNIKSTLKQDNNGNILSTEMISYSYYVSPKYISLSASLYTYLNNEEIETKSTINNYVFDIENGKLLSNRDILKKENITDQDVRIKIREYIKDDQDVDIDATLNSDYSLYVNKNGKVVVNTVVKTSQMDYNISIEMD